MPSLYSAAERGMTIEATRDSKFFYTGVDRDLSPGDRGNARTEGAHPERQTRANVRVLQ